MDSVEKLRFKDSVLLKQLIESHLSFVIDTHFELNQMPNTSNPKKKTQINGTIFGATLTQEGICSVHQLIEFISKDNNLQTEGIFRKSGSTLRQSELKSLISASITVDLEANRFTVHDCCSVLKKFVSDLPEPLLTESHFELFLKISQLHPRVMSPNRSYTKKLSAIQLLLLLIPTPNRQLLQELLNLFEKVIHNSNKNLMTSSSLATIFAPHLFCPRSFSPIQLQQCLNSITDTLIYMIDNSQVICRPPEQLLIDIEKQLQIIDLKSGESTSSLAPVNTAHQFCVQQNAANDDYTAKQLAELYAYMQAIPKTATPMKKKWIKRFNKENGKGTPLLNNKDTVDSTKTNLANSSKKLKIGDMFRAGQQLFQTPKKRKTDKILSP